MDIVSIKRFLRPEQPKPESYIRFLQLLLNGISIHAIDGNELELARFRQEVAGISSKLNVHSTAEEIEVALGFVIRAVTGYNRMAARITHAHVNELQAMLAMMSKTIEFLSQSSKTGIAQLQVVEKNLQTASTVSDVRLLRGKLNDCLVLVRSESTRLREESNAHLVELQAGVDRTANHVRSAGITLPEIEPEAPPEPETRAVSMDDPLTGLQGREAAERMIGDSLARGMPLAVTLFLVHRFAHMRSRFGDQVCDEVLMLVAQHLGEQLETGSLFRWSGPSFVVITEAERSLHDIEQRMAAIASKRFDKTIEKDRGTVLLPITCSSVVQRISDDDSLHLVTETLDDFVAAKSL
jgi:GGDEF domain-containing protein